MIRHKIVGPSERRMPTPRDHHAIGVVNGKLYAIGGRINGRHDRSVADNEEYDPSDQSLDALAPLPTVRSGIVRRCS